MLIISFFFFFLLSFCLVVCFAVNLFVTIFSVQLLFRKVVLLHCRFKGYNAKTQTHLFKQDYRKSITTYLSCAPVRRE